jgi:SAM-dependent methyltransferase
MLRTLDALTSTTLKHVRDRWWDDAFTIFLAENLKPRAGNRILDVGCGAGTAELRLSRLRVSQLRLVGVDLLVDRVAQAAKAADGHNLNASFAAADACRLPFPDATFDSTFCVAVLQHIRQVGDALREFARVTRPGGRILAVEPDNSRRYWYSADPAGVEAFAIGARFFDALAQARGDGSDPAVGPRLPALFAEVGIEPLAVQLFPVSVSRLGPPEPAVWETRRAAIQQEIAKAPDESLRRLGADYLRALEKYQARAASAGPGFVEIQNTLLFAVVGERGE